MTVLSQFVCSLSENQSLFVMPPWRNPSLITAIIASFIMHFVILYFKITNVSVGDKFCCTLEDFVYFCLTSMFAATTLKFKIHGKYFDAHQLEKAVLILARSVQFINECIINYSNGLF